MDYQLISAPLDKAEYLFFAASLKHRGIFYKIAVAEQLMFLEEEFSGHYSVLMQSETGTVNFDLYKDEHEVWVANDPMIQDELLFLIGSQIEEIKE